MTAVAIQPTKHDREEMVNLPMIEALVAADMRDKVDICRYEVGEYLTKRGFPPFH